VTVDGVGGRAGKSGFGGVAGGGWRLRWAIGSATAKHLRCNEP
jgi:hypothetical protein